MYSTASNPFTCLLKYRGFPSLYNQEKSLGESSSTGKSLNSNIVSEVAVSLGVIIGVSVGVGVSMVLPSGMFLGTGLKRLKRASKRSNLSWSILNCTLEGFPLYKHGLVENFLIDKLLPNLIS